MRRVISVWLPTFATDRLARNGTIPFAGEPVVTSEHDGRRRIVTGANPEAQAVGIAAGMPLASAQAMVPGLRVIEADPEADAAALTRLAIWCRR